MATFSDNLRLELQTDGDNPNTWGTILNDNVIKLIDTAIAGYTSVHVCTGGTDVVLPLGDGSIVQSRNAVLKFAGAVSANTNVIIPAKSKIYIINDESTRVSDSTLTVKTSAATGGAGRAIPVGSSELIYCDGVSVFSLNATGLSLGTAADANLSDISTQATADVNGAVTDSTTVNVDNVSDTIVVGQTVHGVGIPEGTTVSTVNSVTQIILSTAVTLADDAGLTFTATISVSSVPPVSVADVRYVRVSVSSSIIGDKTFVGSATFASKIVNTPTSLSGATSITPDFGINNSFTVTLTANVTLQNPSNATAGQGGTIYLIQDGTGSRTMVFGGAYKFPAGSVPVLSTSTSAVDILVYNVRDTSAVDSVVLKSFGR